MILAWTSSAWSEYEYWQGTDKKTVKRINKLIQETMRTPFAGSGKPEPLKHGLKGYWSRRIDREHRLVYKVKGEGADATLLIVQCRFHYE